MSRIDEIKARISQRMDESKTKILDSLEEAKSVRTQEDKAARIEESIERLTALKNKILGSE